MAITHIDADSIVALREKEKLSWVDIGLRMGLDPMTCSKHYYRRKNGEFYFSELVEYFNRMATLQSKDARALHEIAQKKGCTITYYQFKAKLNVYGVCFKGSLALRNKRKQDVIAYLEKHPEYTVRRVVDNTFGECTYPTRRRITQEICNELGRSE